MSRCSKCKVVWKRILRYRNRPHFPESLLMKAGHDSPPKRHSTMSPNPTNHTTRPPQNPRHTPPISHNRPSSHDASPNPTKRRSNHAPNLHHEINARHSRILPNLRTPLGTPNSNSHGSRSPSGHLRLEFPASIFLGRGTIK